MRVRLVHLEDDERDRELVAATRLRTWRSGGAPARRSCSCRARLVKSEPSSIIRLRNVFEIRGGNKFESTDYSWWEYLPECNSFGLRRLDY